MFGGIMETIETTVAPFIQQALGFLDGLAVWMQAAILLALGLFALVGMIVFIKKFFKVILVLGILGGGVWYLYTYTDVIDNLLSSITGAVILLL